MSAPQTCTVLVVEDEPILRLCTADTLSAAGYPVLEAANADEAITLLESHPEIRVLFTDIEMPGSMDGMKLAQAVRRRWPPVAILAVSGRAWLDIGALPSGSRFFAKPYADAQVLGAIHDLCLL